MEKISIIGARGIPKDFSETSGIEAYIERQLTILTRKNRVVCYVRDRTSRHKFSRYLNADIISVPSINSRHLDTFTYSFISTIYALIGNSTIIWYHGIGPSFFSFLPRLFGIKVYVTIHSLDWERKKWDGITKVFLRLSEHIGLLSCTNVYVVSERIRQYYEKKGWPQVILDRYRLYKNSKKYGTEILKLFNLKKYEYIVFVGRLVPEKRVEWLIRASDTVDVPIVIVGGSSHTDTYTESLQKSAKGKNIIFTGPIVGDKKNQLLLYSRLFVLPSETEGFPISVAEALSFNKRCLIGDYLIQEYPVTNLITGFTHNDYTDFLTKLIALCKNDY